MIVEVLTLVSIQAGGMSAAVTMGSRQLRFLIPAGFIAGLCIHLTVAATQSIVLLQTRPWLTIVLTAALPAAWWYATYRRGATETLPVVGTLAALAGVAVAAVSLHAVSLINFHVDSHEYIAIGSMLAADTFRDGVSMFQIEKRMLAVPLMHAPANLEGGYYLASITPLLGIATVLLLAWMLQAGAKVTSLSPRTLMWTSVAAALFLLTFNRFVHNLFYINSHLLFGTLLLVIAGASWVMATTAEDERRLNLLLIQLVAIPVLVITRPEAGLVAALAIVPVALSGRRPLGHKMALVTMLGGSIIVWQVFLLRLLEDRGGNITFAMVGMLAFGAFLLACSPLLGWRFLHRHRIGLVSLLEGLLWLALLTAVLRDSELMANSIRATAINVLGGVGGWGMSMAFLAIVALAALIIGWRSPHRLHLRYPLTAFVALAGLLIYLRGGGYRVGAADSFNRMLIQYVPLTVLFIAATVARRFDAATEEVNAAR